MKVKKSFASLSLDLDNKWSYMKTHGDPGWESFPSYLDILIPRVLQFLKERDLTITFFIVGQDAALEKNHAALRAIAEAGHEIGNHSFRHEPWLHLYTDQELEAEFLKAEEHIKRITGQRPIGFRGPGYSCSETTLRILAQRGYQYDASTLPTFLGPLARAYYFVTTRLSSEEKEERQKLFGTLQDGLRPIRSYRWHIDASLQDKDLIEIPVTTMPIFKVPIHMSYVLYLSMFSESLALFYFRVALGLCRLTRVEPSLLLHPLDFLGYEDVEELSFFPAMSLPSRKKLRIVGEVLRLLTEQFNVVTMKQHAEAIGQKSDCPVIEPNFNSVQV